MRSLNELENIILNSTSMFKFALEDNAINTLFPKGIKIYLELEDERINSIIGAHIVRYFEEEFNNKRLPELFFKYIESRSKSSIDASDFVLFDEILKKMDYQLTFEDVNKITSDKRVKKLLEKGISQDILNANDFLSQVNEFYNIEEEEEKSEAVDISYITDDNVKLYNNDRRLYKLLTLEEEKKYTTLYYETKDPEALDILIGSNQGLVIRVANQYLGRGLEFLDLVQEGNIGLLKVVDKFNPTLGYKFSTYSTWWISQSIRRAVHDKGRAIRIPVHMSERFNRLAKIEARLTQELYRDPTDEEILELWNQTGNEKEKMTVDKIREMRMYKETVTPASLNKYVSDEDESELVDFIEDESIESPVHYVERLEIVNLVDKFLDELSCFKTAEMNHRASQMFRMYEGVYNDETRRIVSQYYEYTDDEKLTLKEIGKIYKISGERVRQIVDKTRRSVGKSLTKYEKEADRQMTKNKKR